MAFLHGTSYLLMALTIFCLWHAFKNRSEQKWYWIILIFPFLGSLFYLYTHFYSRENVQNLAEGVISSVDKGRNIKKLEKLVEFSPSISNKSLLADEYVKQDMFEEAEKLYLSCLEGFNKNDVSVNQKLMSCYAKNHQFEKAIEVGKRIETNKDFQKSQFRIIYAQSLAMNQNIEEAEVHFKAMNSNYSNYPHRIAFASFLIDQNRIEEADKLINKMENEWNNMNRAERKLIPNLMTTLSALRN